MERGEKRMRITTLSKGISKLWMLLFLFALLPGRSFAEDPSLSGGITEGFRGLRWRATLEEALKVIPDLRFDRYVLSAGDQPPSKIYHRKDEDGKIGPVAFERIEYWFRNDSLYKITACLDSHYGPRTLVTDAERDYREFCKELKLQYGEPLRDRGGLGPADLDKYTFWRVGEIIVSLSYKETGDNTSESCLEIKLE